MGKATTLIAELEQVLQQEQEQEGQNAPKNGPSARNRKESLR